MVFSNSCTIFALIIFCVIAHVLNFLWFAKIVFRMGHAHVSWNVNFSYRKNAEHSQTYCFWFLYLIVLHDAQHSCCICTWVFFSFANLFIGFFCLIGAGVVCFKWCFLNACEVLIKLEMCFEILTMPNLAISSQFNPSIFITQEFEFSITENFL